MPLISTIGIQRFQVSRLLRFSGLIFQTLIFLPHINLYKSFFEILCIYVFFYFPPH